MQYWEWECGGCVHERNQIVTKKEPLLALLDRLDAAYAEDDFANSWDEALTNWPRLSRDVRDLREFLEQYIKSRYQWGFIEKARQLLARIDGREG